MHDTCTLMLSDRLSLLVFIFDSINYLKTRGGGGFFNTVFTDHDDKNDRNYTVGKDLPPEDFK